jgi:hypothetical protein
MLKGVLGYKEKLALRVTRFAPDSSEILPSYVHISSFTTASHCSFSDVKPCIHPIPSFPSLYLSRALMLGPVTCFSLHSRLKHWITAVSFGHPPVQLY